MYSLLNKGPIGNDILRLHGILATYNKFLNKPRNFLLIMSFPEMESRIISIFKDVSDVSKLLGLKGSGTIKALRIYQYFSTSIFDILPWLSLEFDTLQMVKIIFQNITGNINNGNHGGNIDRRSSCCQRHQYQYLLNKII